VFKTLVLHGSRPASIAQLLINICEREASQFVDSSTNVEWWEPVLERLGYITRELSLSGQAPPDQKRTNRYTPSNIRIQWKANWVSLYFLVNYFSGVHFQPLVAVHPLPSVQSSKVPLLIVIAERSQFLPILRLTRTPKSLHSTSLYT
jgi:hypothetical protein